MLHRSVYKVSVIALLLVTIILITAGAYSIAHGALSCSATTTCNSPAVVLLRLSSSTNAHAQLPSQSGYTELICCTGDATLATTCTGTFAVSLVLSSTTNAHVEEDGPGNYTENACVSLSTGTVSVGYQANNCTGFDTTIASISASTNAHAGVPGAYTTKVCGSTSIPQSLTFTISDNIIGYGQLSSAVARFATGDGVGTTTETEAHTLAVTTSAASGYTLTLKGATLSAGLNTILAIGGTNTASSPGSEQFGLRMNASGGSGTVTSPYAAAGFAYAGTATTSSQVASAATGDSVMTTYSTRYIANIGTLTEAASYSSILTYTLTANY